MEMLERSWTKWLGLALVACAQPDTPYDVDDVVAKDSSDRSPMAFSHLAPGTLLDCPNHLGVLIYDGVGVQNVPTLPISEGITTVPEYHDCQRFVVAGDKYGPLVAIMAPHSDTSETPPPPMTSPDSAVALIVSGGVYSELDISAGYNCLYLWKAKRQWEARVVSVPDPKRCKEKLGDERTRAAMGLHVRELPPPPKDLDGPYPRGARWDMTPWPRRQYISISCGSKWCEVRRNAVGLWSKTYDVALSDAERAVFGIKGWYDEQPLPEKVPATPPLTSPYWMVQGTPEQILPSVVGTVIPEPGLKNITSMADFNNGWVATARVHLRGKSDKYKQEYGFEAGVLPDRMNMISACANKVACPIPADAPNCDVAPPGITQRLYVRITSANSNAVKYRCLDYRKHAVHGPQRTARWRWPDEAVALPQPNGPMGFGLGVGIPTIRPLSTRLLLNGGGGFGGIWHWCPEGCCTM